MDIRRTTPCGAVALLLIGTISGCGDSSQPTSPSATPIAASVQAALADGVITLKVDPPILRLPINNAVTASLTPVLEITNSQPRHLLDHGFTYEFEVYEVLDNGEELKWHITGVPQTPNTTSHTVVGDLKEATAHIWRARSEVGDDKGPWSDAATFVTPTLLEIPTPVSPINGATTSNTRPTFVVQNGDVSADSAQVTYEFQLDDETQLFPNPSTFHAPRSSGTQTTAQFADALATDMTFYWRVRATVGTVITKWSDVQTFQTPSVTSGPRTPDPPPGQDLQLPNQSALIHQLGITHAAELANSCIEEGGSWDFMDAAVTALRATDTRWGYNCKRGDCNHVSIDVVDYFYGIGDGVGSTDVYRIDIIGAVCPGGNQTTSWVDQTEVTADHGTIGIWIFPR